MQTDRLVQLDNVVSLNTKIYPCTMRLLHQHVFPRRNSEIAVSDMQLMTTWISWRFVDICVFCVTRDTGESGVIPTALVDGFKIYVIGKLAIALNTCQI